MALGLSATDKDREVRVLRVGIRNYSAGLFLGSVVLKKTKNNSSNFAVM